MVTALRLSVSLLILTVALSGCRHDNMQTEDIVYVSDCYLSLAGEGSVPTLRIGLYQTPEASRAPQPSSQAERLLFTQLYDTLLHLDCEGALQPALASSWQRMDEGRYWRFELRENARFSDGTEVLASDVKACWLESNWQAQRALARLPWDLLGDPASVVSLDGPRGLLILAGTLGEQLPRLLSMPAFGIAGRRDYLQWPLATGPCQLTLAENEEWRVLPNPEFDGDAPRWQRMIFRLLTGDARDVFQDELDLLTLREVRYHDYFRDKPDLRMQTLPDERIYLLAFSKNLNWAGEVEVDELLGRTLNCDTAPSPLDVFTTVGDTPTETAGIRYAQSIVTLHGDGESYSLAARLCALAEEDLVVRKLAPPVFFSALAESRADAAIVSIPALWASAGLLESALSDLLGPGMTVRPLLTSRPRILSRRNLGGLKVHLDGIPRLNDLGPAAESLP